MKPFIVIDPWETVVETTRAAPEGRAEAAEPVSWPGLADRVQVLVHTISVGPAGQYHVEISFKTPEYYTAYETVAPADEEGAAAVRALAGQINDGLRKAARAQARAQAFHDGTLGAE